MLGDFLMHDFDDSFVDGDDPKSSQIVWDAIQDAEREFQPWQHFVDRIETMLSCSGNLSIGQSRFFSDREFDIWWASLEIMKPAIYTKPPQPVVTPRFSDRDPVAAKASEILERCLVSTFDRGDINEALFGVRDDLIIGGRGEIRVTYETDAKGGGQRVCNDHIDRCDFLHEPARKWTEVGWVAFAAHLTKREFKKRFKTWVASNSIDTLPFCDTEDASRRYGYDGSNVERLKVWEVWHKADDRVYWVCEGCQTFLDEQPPYIKLDGFFPCPKPAYGTKRSRTMIPVPDYIRYEHAINQINVLTRRVYALLDRVRLAGFYAGGGDVGTAVETMLSEADSAMMLIPVSGAALSASGGDFIQWIPLAEIAQTITGLIEARRELINNFYELSGISDIMRGATEAQETLGAQQLKQQNGSIRIRDKVLEMTRIAVDAARITAEIIAEKFDEDTILEMAQMELPTAAEIKKKIKELEESAAKEMEDLEQEVASTVQQAAASGEQMPPEAQQQAEQQFQEKQQEIIARYQPMISDLGKTVTREQVFKLLRKNKSRSFSIEIQTDSTILTDENAEKAARAEFLTAFGSAITAVQPLLMAGEAGATLAGGMIKFAVAPYRAGRELDGMIDAFVDQAPQMAAAMQKQNGEGEDAGLAEAQMKLAEAEQMKAQAQTAKVQADSQLKQAELQGKMQEFQLKMAAEQAKAQDAQNKLQLEGETLRGKLAEQDAKINLMQAQTAEILTGIGLDARKQDLEEYRAAADIEARAVDQTLDAEREQRETMNSEREAVMAEASFVSGEQRAARGEDRADRQQSFAETQAERDGRA